MNDHKITLQYTLDSIKTDLFLNLPIFTFLNLILVTIFPSLIWLFLTLTSFIIGFCYI